MHPAILHDLASQHAREMHLTATVARRAQQARRARRGYRGTAVPSRLVPSGGSVRHA